MKKTAKVYRSLFPLFLFLLTSSALPLALEHWGTHVNTTTTPHLRSRDIFIPPTEARTDGSVTMKQAQVYEKYSYQSPRGQRRLQAQSRDDGFRALDCNMPACNGGTFTWEQQVRNTNREVIIPCGRCITLDASGLDSNRLVLPLGLDVQGHLTITGLGGNNNNNDTPILTIVTLFVRVQGALNIQARGRVSGTPKLVVTLVDSGSSRDLTSFVPADNNRRACTVSRSGSVEACTVGPKPFVVAGGILDIQGLPNTCKTWVVLEDTTTETVEVDMSSNRPNGVTRLHVPNPSDPNPRCRSYEPYIQDDFSGGRNPNRWAAAAPNGARSQALARVTAGDFLRVSGRTSSINEGPWLNLLPFRDCLVGPTQVYLFSARIRLRRAGYTSDSPTTCARTGNFCLTLQSTVRTPDLRFGRSKEREQQTDRWAYDTWHDFITTFTMDADELDPRVIYHSLQFEGPEPGVEIELDDVVFSLPPPELVPNPDDVCAGNLIMNGSAEGSPVHPYPMRTFGRNEVHVDVITGSGGNRYFRVSGRRDDTDSIMYSVDAFACMVRGSRFKAVARVRVLSDVSVVTRMVLWIPNRLVVAECPPASRQWVTCEADFVLLDKIEDNEARLTFETVNAPHVAFDIFRWSLNLVEGPTTGLVLPSSGVSGCWTAGAEVLITSHTLDFESSQVRKIAVPPQNVGNGFVRIELDSFIVPPIARRHGDGAFAVEVALLSRNIVFEAAVDASDELLGGHLIILHTPRIRQRLDGIELRNFGRQGEIGRYPVHFHMCGDVDGAVVSRNSIRDSKQRCIVVHGTHNATVIENIAFENKGHCFMTEDGGELDNRFVRNLGSNTRATRHLTRPTETDRSNPSTFWASNPSNEWVGNVAAGGESSGFWFELEFTVRSPTSFMPLSQGMVPRRLPLKLFLDNVAHSNRRHGLRTYPNGLLPPVVAKFEGTRSYKNRNAGVFFHNSQDLLLAGGVLADNLIQADLDRVDNVFLEGTTMIGTSGTYRDILRTQTNSRSHSDTIIGIDFHSFTLEPSLIGSTIRDIHFVGFSYPSGTDSSLFRVDGRQKRTGSFDYWTTIRNITLVDSLLPAHYFDFHSVADIGVTNVYIIDLDSSLKPPGSGARGVSAVISDSPEMKEFLDVDRCESQQPGAQYLYCSQICLRTVTFGVDPAGTSNFKLRVVAAGNPSKSFDFSGHYFHETIDESDGYDYIANTKMRKLRYFTVALPADNYRAHFVREGVIEPWPTFVETTYEQELCDDALAVGSVELSIPKPSRMHCRELIRNGDMEASTSSIPFWLHHESGIELVPGGGTRRSNGLSDLAYSRENEIGQYLDVRCLTQGEQFSISAMVRLETSDGDTFDCGGSSCPTIRLRSRTPDDETGTIFSSYAPTVATAYARPFARSGWKLLHGVLTIDSRISAGSSVAMFLDRGLPNIKMYVDNVSFTKIPSVCSELIFNGNLATGTTQYWATNSNRAILDIQRVGSTNALVLTGRAAAADTVVAYIRTGCMVESARYKVTARMKLLLVDGALFACDPRFSSGARACPSIHLRSTINHAQPTQDTMGHDEGAVARTDFGLTSDGWYTMSGTFSATGFDAIAEESLLTVEDAPARRDLVLTDISIVPIEESCAQLFQNGNVQGAETPMFWTTYLSGSSGARLEIESGRIVVSERKSAADGLTQYVDPSCLLASKTWRLSGRIELRTTGGRSVTCDPNSRLLEFGCPPIRVVGFVQGARRVDDRFYSPSGISNYEVDFQVSVELAECDGVVISIRNYNLDWILIADNLSLVPL